jgi:hypothetical protein
MKSKLFNSIVLVAVTSIVVAGIAGYLGLSHASSYALTSYFTQSGGLIADSDYSWPAASEVALGASAPGSREVSRSSF